MVGHHRYLYFRAWSRSAPAGDTHAIGNTIPSGNGRTRYMYLQPPQDASQKETWRERIGLLTGRIDLLVVRCPRAGCRRGIISTLIQWAEDQECDVIVVSAPRIRFHGIYTGRRASCGGQAKKSLRGRPKHGSVHTEEDSRKTKVRYRAARDIGRKTETEGNETGTMVPLSLCHLCSLPCRRPALGRP